MKKLVAITMAMITLTVTGCMGYKQTDSRTKIDNGPLNGLFGGAVYVTHHEVTFGEPIMYRYYGTAKDTL